MSRFVQCNSPRKQVTDKRKMEKFGTALPFIRAGVERPWSRPDTQRPGIRLSSQRYGRKKALAPGCAERQRASIRHVDRLAPSHHLMSTTMSIDGRSSTAAATIHINHWCLTEGCRAWGG